MDHDTALRSANQVLEGRRSPSSSNIASVELRAIGSLNSVNLAVAPFDSAAPPRSATDSSRRTKLPAGAWELAAMVSVGLVTVVAVIGLWFY